MTDRCEFPLGIQPWPTGSNRALPREGFEYSLLEGCNNAYRFTAMASGNKIATIFQQFSRLLADEAFFILEYYPEEMLLARPSGKNERPVPVVFYSPYLPTDYILDEIAPYLERLIHDGFVGFGIANNRRGLEFFYSEEKVLTFFTDNHLRLSHFLHQQQIPHRDKLVLPEDFGHNHLSLLQFTPGQLPGELSQFRGHELDATLFCHEITENLEMYQVEEGLSFFLTRKEQELIEQLIKERLPEHELAEVEFGGLLLDWSDFVAECDRTFSGDLWEYRQGLLIRDAIQMVIEMVPEELGEKITSIIADADLTLQKNLIDQRKRLDFPTEIKLKQQPFWYQGVVKKQGTDLRRDLIRQGWFKN